MIRRESESLFDGIIDVHVTVDADELDRVITEPTRADADAIVIISEQLIDSLRRVMTKELEICFGGENRWLMIMMLKRMMLE